MFKNLDGAHVNEQSSEVFTFYDLPGEPWIRVKPGGDLNKPYYRALLNKQSKSSRRQALRGKIDADMLDRNRKLDRVLFAQHIAGGEWGGWIDENEQEVPYSQQAVKELFEQLPSYLFDSLRAFCNQPENFQSEDEPIEEDIEETAGN